MLFFGSCAICKISLILNQNLQTKFMLYKAQKDSVDMTVFLRFWDLHVWKLRLNMLVKSNLGLNFTNTYVQL